MSGPGLLSISVVIAYLFFIFFFLVIAYIPLYFTIKWAVRKALREVANDGPYNNRFHLDE